MITVAKSIPSLGPLQESHVLFKHNRQLVSSSCSGVRPFKDACVATGMNIGRSTDPCGKCIVDALALLV